MMDGHAADPAPTSPPATSMLQRLHQERLQRQRQRSAGGSSTEAVASAAASSAADGRGASARAGSGATSDSEDAGSGGDGAPAPDTRPPFPTRGPVWLDNGDVPPVRPAAAPEPAPVPPAAAPVASVPTPAPPAAPAAAVAPAAVVAAPVKPTSEETWDDFACSVCLKLLLEPVAVRCGHTFCRRCLKRALQFNVRGRTHTRGHVLW